MVKSFLNFTLFRISFSYDKKMSLGILTLHFYFFLHKETTDCTSEPEVGPCKAAIPRFYFDKSDNRCKNFTYGGCYGNNNNYKTADECYLTCDMLDRRGKV